MTIQEVTTTQQQRQFASLPHRLHRAVPAYIGALDNEIDAVFDPAKNKLFEAGGTACRWLLADAHGMVVGRVAAFLNPQTAHIDPTLAVGGLGFFECIDDQAAANQLLDVACNWLRAKGMEAVDGPINFGDRDRFWGVLIDGFEYEPNYGMFWHPPYYQRLFESYGFQLYFKQFTCFRFVSKEDQPLHQRFAAKYQEAVASGYRFADSRGVPAEQLAQHFLHVYNLAWGRHTGVKEMTIAQARNLVRELKPVLDPKVLFFAFQGDEPVAFYINLPELNQIFKRIGHRLDLLGKLRFVYEKWRYMRRPDKKMLGIIYGVVPDHQNKSLDLALVAFTQQPVTDAGYHTTEMNWIGDFNPRMMVSVRALGGKVIKTHVTYRKLFIDRPFERYPIIR